MKFGTLKGKLSGMRLTLKFFRSVSYVALAAVLSSATAGTSQRAAQPPLITQAPSALDGISAESMRGHLSFIASDLLEGRDTPSRGLDIAAEYIAAQFRRAGLEPLGDDGYFQTANFMLSELDRRNFMLSLRFDGREIQATADQVSFNFRKDWNFENVPVVKIRFGDAAGLDALAADIGGKIVLTDLPRFAGGIPNAPANQFLTRLQTLKPALIVDIDRMDSKGSGGGPAFLVDPENPQGGDFDRFLSQNPLLTLNAPDALPVYDRLPIGLTTATISVRARSAQKPVKLRNVIGVLRGSDPVLRETCVVLSAHYDHVGLRSSGSGDRIFNGANDDGSGTVSVIEIASALASMKERPKRSLVFMTFFGEEKGMLGSRYYTRHPIFPIEKTIAGINLEQLGRTDSTEGPQLNNSTMTGFDFSDIGQIFRSAGELTGITVYKHERNSDAYFGRSDNAAFAILGVPAHTVSVAFDFPDYHRVSDHWEKVDFENMARVDRMIALGLLTISNAWEEPQWNAANPRTAPFVKAWKDRHTVPQQ